MFSQNVFFLNYFHKFLLCGTLGNSLSTGRNVGKGKVAYSWISLDLVKVEPTLGGGIVVLNRIGTQVRLDR